MSEVAGRLHKIQTEIAKAAPGRKVEIIGVAKFQPVARLKEAVEAGLTSLGSNYAQEGEEFQQALQSYSLEWHFIGHIQSRKVKFLPHYAWVQSLDRLEIAQALEAKLAQLGKIMRGCVEVNIGEESQKSGIVLSEVESFLKACAGFKFLKLEGLMCMPPFVEIEARRQYFKKMASAFSELRQTYRLTTLSMGTSDDYMVAVEEGSTMVRLGTCLFGSRPAL